MRLGVPTAATVAAILGCCNPCGGSADVEAIRSATVAAEPTEVVDTFLRSAGEHGGFAARCGECLTLAADGDAKRVIEDPTCKCPDTCATEGFVEAQGDRAAERMMATCDGEREDPLFTAPLRPLLAVSDPVRFGAVHSALLGIDDADLTEDLRESLVIGLALEEPPREPTARCIVSGADERVLNALAEPLRACGDDVAHRFVIAPDGTSRAVAPAEGCVSEAILATPQRRGEWRVVDLTCVADALPTEEIEEEPVAEAPRPRPAPTGGDGPTGPTLPAEHQEILALYAKQFRYCYERELKADASLRGQVLLDFTVATDGSVRSISTSGSLSRQLGGCVRNRAGKMTFPPLDETTPVRLPLVFQPQTRPF